ncbi:unnamed protein product [Trifolium pratense]|uniref:Uncharacterized protein n=1 Tax=Trifolium pratense TaxID=57577 RepID=A0ACB0IPC3_TRIPR|nr:unnamed protein product [Trifolium pratense]
MIPYLGRIRNFQQEAEAEKRQLLWQRKIVQLNVDAIDKTTKVNIDVLKWLNDVDKTIEEIVKLEILDRPNVKMRNDFLSMIEKMKMLYNNCEFESYSSTTSPLKSFSSEDFVCFKSTNEASDELLEALQDDKTRIIGLYGKRGSGKTTLVQAVGKMAKYLNIFDAVLFATVSHNPNVMKIQDQFANSLKIKFDRNTTVARAIKIYSTLQSIGRILVILDDVREIVDPEDFGIPCNDNQCKVLLTSLQRLQEPTFMECQARMIRLNALSKDEAWTLLQKYSDINDESPSDILNVASEIVNECEGLHSTIKDVGYFLRYKSIGEWKASLDCLKHSQAQWEIFLSFRGQDTRHSFTGSLYHALCQVGFKTFMDDGALRNGDQISPILVNAIETSRLSIIVLSENYASSSWCLDELSKILECMETHNQLVWPIFFNVEPSDIRHQKNSYGDAMAKQEQKFGNDSARVKKWRSALLEVSSLSGKTNKYGYEYEYKFIQKIVEDAKNIKNRLYIRSSNKD